MKLIDGLKKYGKIGLISLIVGCSSIPQELPPEKFEEPQSKELSFEARYGKLMWISLKGNYLEIGFDRDNDWFEDLRLIYEIISINKKNVGYFKLIERLDDKNRNGFFEKEERTKVIVTQDNPILEKDLVPFENLTKYYN
jgi:hypothetical protein